MAAPKDDGRGSLTETIFERQAGLDEREDDVRVTAGPCPCCGGAKVIAVDVVVKEETRFRKEPATQACPLCSDALSAPHEVPARTVQQAAPAAVAAPAAPQSQRQIGKKKK